MKIKKIFFTTKILFLQAVVLGLSACNQTPDATLLSSRVLAKVNGEEITVNQFNTELKHAFKDREPDQQAKEQLLAGMINRQLLAQEAVKLNLDRAPEIVDAISSFKTQLYAQAYMLQKTAKLPPVSEPEIAEFIENHPEVFAYRKVFTTTDVTFSKLPSLDVTALQSQAKDLKALQASLDAQGVKYQVMKSSFSSDMLPPVWQKKLSQVQAGDLLFTQDDASVLVKAVTSISDSAMPPDQARYFAEKTLTETRKQKFLLQEVERLRKLSNINVLSKKG